MKMGNVDCQKESSLTVSAADFDAVRCGEEPAALLLSGEAVWHVAVELEGGGVEGRVEGVLAPGVAPVQRVAHEATDAVRHCNTHSFNIRRVTVI